MSRSQGWLRFQAPIEKVDINPCVAVPREVSDNFEMRGFIPVELDLSGSKFVANLVPLGKGEFRLYLNGPMLKATGWQVGDTADIRLRYDPKPRLEPIPPALAAALKTEPVAQKRLSELPISRQKEIFRYINNLKSADAVDRNVKRIIGALSGTDSHPTVRPDVNHRPEREAGDHS
jgi:hypothetical protein